MYSRKKINGTHLPISWNLMYLKASHLICLFSKVLSIYLEHSECLDTKKKKYIKIPGTLFGYYKFRYLILATCFLRHGAFHERSFCLTHLGTSEKIKECVRIFFVYLKWLCCTQHCSIAWKKKSGFIGVFYFYVFLISVYFLVLTRLASRNTVVPAELFFLSFNLT